MGATRADWLPGHDLAGDEGGETWPFIMEKQSPRHCRFEISPPRRFLYPALLLLLAEEPSYGYRLVESLSQLGLGRINRPSIYKALGDLEGDGLIYARDEVPLAGSTRHVYALTDQGKKTLEYWMFIVGQEVRGLDLVLRRYWDCTDRYDLFPAEGRSASRRSGPVKGASSDRRDGDVTWPSSVAQENGRAGARRMLFKIQPEHSLLVVEAHSSVGPIAFATNELSRVVDVVVADECMVDVDVSPSASMEVSLSSLSSGNRLYDAELRKRIQARKYPKVVLTLSQAERIGQGNRYDVMGEVSLHGVKKLLKGALSVAVRQTNEINGGKKASCLVVAGEHVLDIRQFGLTPPRMGPLKIYPDVRLQVHLEATCMGIN